MAGIIHSYYDWQRALEGEELPGLQKTYGLTSIPYVGGSTIEPAEIQVQKTAAPRAQEKVTIPEVSPEFMRTSFTGDGYGIDYTPWYGGYENTGRYSNLFRPVQEQLQAAQGLFGEQAQSFLEQAGPSRTFSGLGGEDILGRAVETGEGFDEAGKLLSAKYGGPTQISETNYGPLFSELGQRSESLRSPFGVMDLLSSTIAPTLTPGMLKFEAQRILSDPDYREEARALQNAIQSLGGGISAAQEQAGGIAEQRTAEEQAIANLAREYLKNRETTIDKATAAQLAQAEETNRQAQELYERFRGGDVEVLKDLSKITDPELMGQYESWSQAREQIFNKPEYQKLARFDIPEMIRDEGALGSEWRFDDEWFKENEKRFSKGQWKEIKELARARQKEMEALGAIPESPMAIYERTARAQKAADLYNQIMDQYPTIKSYPPLKVKIDHHGRARYMLMDPVTGKDTRIRNVNMDDATRNLLLERQAKLEQYFGDIVDPRYKTEETALYGGTKFEGQERWAGAPQRGEYADIMNLYYGGDLAPMSDPRRFFELQLVSPSRESVSTQEQREQYNRINQLLGEAERISEADPYQGVKLIADVDRYLAEEEAILAENEDRLDARRKDWLNKVRLARQRYKDRHDKIYDNIMLGGLALITAGAGAVPTSIGLASEIR